MIIKIDNTQANQELVGAFNDLIEKLKGLSVRQEMLKAEIEEKKGWVEEYKKSTKVYYNKRTEVRKELGGLRKQIADVYGAIKVAKESKVEELKKEQSRLIKEYQSKAEIEAEYDDTIKNYETWRASFIEKHAEDKKELASLQKEIDDISKNIVVVSRILQGRCGADFYSSLIISSLLPAEEEKGKPLTINSFKLDIAENESCEESEN